MRGGVAKKWTTEVCGRSVQWSSNDFGDQRLLEESLVLLQPQIYEVSFFGRGRTWSLGVHQHQWYHRV